MSRCEKIAFVLFFAVNSFTARSFGADGVSPVHLVGHEDAAALSRVRDLINVWDPRKLVDPLVLTSESRNPAGEIEQRKHLRREDLAEFIADVDAAQVLGKAFFWEMQAGSDFRRLADGRYVGTACASCHYRYGADARSRYTMRIPYVVWNEYHLDGSKPLALGERQLPFNVRAAATQEASLAQPSPFGNLSPIVGSAGVEPRIFHGLRSSPPASGAWESELSTPRNLSGFQYRPHWSMFVEVLPTGTTHFRQITARNSPSVFNSGFSDRLFHDGRAESTFNGFSIFGDRDQRPVHYRQGARLKSNTGVPRLDLHGNPLCEPPVLVDVAITKAALASQAVGPIVNEVEMSYFGRSFPNLACKLLDSRVLGYQDVSPKDGLLGKWAAKGLIGKRGTLTYRELIKLAFRREWWDGGSRDEQGVEWQVPLTLMGDRSVDLGAEGKLPIANFSLFWGLSIMLHESSLVSNQSPFDAMMLGKSEKIEQRWSQAKQQLGTIRLDQVILGNGQQPVHQTGTAVFQHGFRVFLNRGCVECHAGPLFSETYERAPDAEEFAIWSRLRRLLLPNSKSEAIAVKRQMFHERILKQVAALIAHDLGLDAAKALAHARLIDLLREEARGDQVRLTSLVGIREPGLSTAHREAVAELLLRFERQAVANYGNRAFFSEDERVEFAAKLVEPVLVEDMTIPQDFAEERPRLPVAGPLATTDYAFYDLGFYALGVQPPRYDAGIGEVKSVPPRLQALFHAASEEASASDEPEPRKRRIVAQLSAAAEAAENQRPIPQLDVAALEQLEQTAQRISPRQQPSSGAPGSAYQFKAQWQSPEVIESIKAAAPPSPRTCRQGPSYDPDDSERNVPAPIDVSWDRNFLPSNTRRGSLLFLSRARTLVSDEEPWGFRKPFLHDNELAFWGAFKAPTLRNVELTAPFMHNGRLASLHDVIEFYDGAGFISVQRDIFPDKHPAIRELHMTAYDRLALEFFLMCLTDERVRLEQAPFDHPSLNLVHGYNAALVERVFLIEAVGANGWTNPDGSAAPSKVPPPFPHAQ